MKKYAFLALALIIAALLITAAAFAESADATSGATAAQYVNDTDTNGESGLLSDFKAYNLNGKVIDQSILEDYDLTMVNIWATFCGPCLEEMPTLGNVARAYKDKGFQIIGLVADTVDQDGEILKKQVKLARKQVKKTKADYTHLLPSEDLYGILNQIEAYPTSFFVDSKGRQVGNAYEGSLDKETCVQLIKEAYAELSK